MYDKETRQIRQVTLAAFCLNLGLAVMKGILAAGTDSLAITASVIDSATDCFASLAVYIGIRLSTRKTKQFPLGLYKIENVISVVIAIFIFFAGYEVAREIFFSAGSPKERMSGWTVILLGAASASVFIFGRVAVFIGRRTGSPALLAEGKHRQIDFLSSLVVLISAALSYFRIDFSFRGIGIDEIAAGIVLIFIAKAGWELLTDGMRVLLDASVDHDTLVQAKEIIEAEPAVANVINLLGRNAGRFRFIQASIELRTDNLQKAHQITERIENEITKKMHNVERVIIHYAPLKKQVLQLAVPVDVDRKTVYAHFGEADLYLFAAYNRKSGQFEKKSFHANPYPDWGKGKGLKIAEWLVGEGIDGVGVKENLVHKGPGYVFKNAGVAIHITKQNAPDAALDELIEELL